MINFLCTEGEHNKNWTEICIYGLVTYTSCDALMSQDVFKNRHREIDKSTEEHFNKPGHTMADMKITILEKIKSQDPQLRKIRESLFIQKFNTRYKGLNKKS